MKTAHKKVNQDYHIGTFVKNL